MTLILSWPIFVCENLNFSEKNSLVSVHISVRLGYVCPSHPVSRLIQLILCNGASARL